MSAIQNITITQGDLFTLPMTLTTVAGVPLDLTAYTASAQLRDDYAASTPVNFSCVIGSPATSGSITVSLYPSQSAALTVTSKVWDIQIASGSNYTLTLLGGSVTVIPEVTR